MGFLTNFFISCKESRIENNKSFYGCYHLGPFEPGQSLTIANALRRTLLSELKGLAITGVEIEGAQHEYSNLVGVKDSVLDILLNLKEIVLRKRNNFNTSNNFWRISTFNSPFLESQNKLFGNSKIFKGENLNAFDRALLDELKSFAYLKVRGPGVVRASDLRLPPNIQCVDPEQYIATLTEDGSLNIKLIIEEGEKFVESLNITLFDEGDSLQVADVPITTNKFKNTLISNIDKLIPQKILSQKYELIEKALKQGENSQQDNKTFEMLKENGKLKESAAGTVSSQDSNSTTVPRQLDEENSLSESKLEGSRSLEKTKIQIKNGAYSYNQLNRETHFLKIDAVFNPVTKVNYTIEIQEHEKINRHFESSSYLEQTLEILSARSLRTKSITAPYSGENKKFLQILLNLTHKNKIKAGWNLSNARDYLSKKKERGVEVENSLKGRSKAFTKNGEVMNFLNTPTLIKHKIILEIWTNGSLHPRQALQIALNNLVNIFIKLQKTQVYTNFLITNKKTVVIDQQKLQDYPKTSRTSKVFFKDLEVNNTYTLSRNTKDFLFQKWLSKYILE